MNRMNYVILIFLGLSSAGLYAKSDFGTVFGGATLGSFVGSTVSNVVTQPRRNRPAERVVERPVYVQQPAPQYVEVYHAPSYESERYHQQRALDQEKRTLEQQRKELDRREAELNKTAHQLEARQASLESEIAQLKSQLATQKTETK